MQAPITAIDIPANIARVRAQMERAAREAGRDTRAVKLVAVSKTHPAQAVAAAIAAGQTAFGENRVQEALQKFPDLKSQHPGIELHLIGPLQSNKVRDAIALFDVIHTLDRESLALALVREREKSGSCPKLFVQVNTGEEPQKSGLAPRELSHFLKRCRDEWKLEVSGLMCIPPAEDIPAPHFALLAVLARGAGLNQLSMGMSGDFEAAIALGSTCVRLGSAIFGERET